MGCVGFDSHLLQSREELLALTEEKPIGRKAGDCSHGSAKLIVQRANDRDVGKVRADEFAWHGEDEAGLYQAGWLERRVGEEVGED